MPERAGLRVLVVDDEPLICWSLTETLTDAGNAVTEARTAAAGLRVVASSPDAIDVVLLDYHLPDSHDLSLLSKIVGLAPRARVIVMSANIPLDVAERALELGACRVIGKPIDMEEVGELVREVVRTGH